MSDLPRLPAAEPVTLTGVSLYLRELDAYLAEKFAEKGFASGGVSDWYRAWHRGWTRSDDYSFWLGANG